MDIEIKLTLPLDPLNEKERWALDTLMKKFFDRPDSLTPRQLKRLDDLLNRACSMPKDELTRNRLVDQLEIRLLKEARDLGAAYPALADTGPNGFPVILDSDSGRTWRVKLEEF